MVDDEQLLEVLERALAPEPVEPPPERVMAVRLLAERGAPTLTPERWEPVTPARGRRNWPQRFGWSAAGLSVAAAAVVIAMLVLPGIVSDGRTGDRTSATGSATPAAVVRLRAALMSGNPVAVARADADLLREEQSIAEPARDEAVAAHVEAIQFLRDHPSAEVTAELPPPTSIVAEPSVVPTSVAPSDDSDPAPVDPVPTTLDAPPPADGSLDVVIDAVVPRLDGTFAVEFTVSGFTPDASGAPGSYSVTFSFDEGGSPARWGGPSPWAFPLANGVVYHQVCAHVADAEGVVDLSTGGCRNIL